MKLTGLRRIALFLLIIILLLSVCSCQNNTSAQTETKSDTQVQEAEKQEPVPEKSQEDTRATIVPEIIETPVVEAKATLETQPSYSMLKEGDENEEVAKLQDRLIELDYLNSSATGYYGSVTKSAVKRFQKVNDLQADGIAGEETQALLYSDSAKSCPEDAFLLSGLTIGLDPGHQAKGDSSQEPVAPGSDVTKKKVSSGTSGDYSGVEEYKVNLNVALILRDMLEAEGADVVMTHTTADVNISNIERAQVFNNAGTDYALRIHCNGTDDHSKQGAFVIVPDDNPYLGDCKKAGEILIDEYCKATDFKNLGTVSYSDQTGFNWCERMIINIEMGHMSNEHDDMLLTNEDYQKQMAQGIFNGIVRYFEEK